MIRNVLREQRDQLLAEVKRLSKAKAKLANENFELELRILELEAKLAKENKN